MLLWHRDRYEFTAADVIAGEVYRYVTPSGVRTKSAPLPISSREPWEIHQVQCVLNNAAGGNKRGCVVDLVAACDHPSFSHSLMVNPANGMMGPSAGVRYVGPPFISLYGVGWWARLTAYVAGDVMHFWILWREVREPK